MCISLKFILWGGVGPIDFSVLLETYKGEITVTGIMGLCQARIREYLILLLRNVLCLPMACSLLGGVVPSQNSVYKGTRLCSSIVLTCYFITLHPNFHPSVSSCSVPSSPYNSAADLSLAPFRSKPSFSHLRRDTHAPVLLIDFSQRSRIGRIAIYCATLSGILMT